MKTLAGVLRRPCPAGIILTGGLLAAAAPAPAQEPPPEAAVEAVVVDAAAPEFAPGISLTTGESVVVWIESEVEVGAPDVGGRPVPDAEEGAVIARFGDSGPFAWPVEPTVWTAPATGWLSFGLNGHAGHRMTGRARAKVARLEASRSAFARPRIELERVGGGVRVRWTDRAGFGIDEATLSFRLTTAHGTVHDLGAWGPVDDGGVLPLPPPVGLPPGVHRLSATITDHLGNRAPRSTVTFDTPS